MFKNNDQVIFFAVHTVFEGYSFNTPDKLRYNQEKYKLKIPMAQAAGDPGNRRAPEVMIKYRSGGTPWKIIINPKGKVVYNNFHIKPSQAVSIIESQIDRGK